MKFAATFNSSRHHAEGINIREVNRLDHWCRTFGVTRQQLCEAVSVVGSNPDLVRRHLRINNTILH